MRRAIPALVVAVGALCLGLYLGGHPTSLPGKLRDVFVDEQVSLQAQAADTIEDHYYRKVSRTKLENASISGMVRSLHSRFSAYFAPVENKLFKESLGGQFSGVGMTVVKNKRGLRIASIFPASPAKRAGIEPGDLITRVDGKSIAGQSSEVASARIKGKPGTQVRLTIVSRGKTRVERVTRQTIKVPVVAGAMRRAAGRKLGVVRITSFTPGVHSDVRKQVTRLQKRGARGFVLDLRGNGGGLLDEAVLVSSVFIPDGTIVTTEGRTVSKKTYNATGDALTRAPIVPLVDRGTASASEIVTAALQERLSSRVVGRRTVGKGVFGQLFPLSNGGALDLVIGNYYTPDGSSLNGKGIKPDVELSRAANADPTLALDRALQVLAAQVQRRERSRPSR
ncbi:MAG: S41 family peptidase [Solirubrobacterales bacterium]